MMETFDDFLWSEGNGVAQNTYTFQTRKDKSEKGTLEWLVNNFEACDQEAQSRYEVYRKCLDLYKGCHWKDISGKNAGTSRKPKVVNNHAWDKTEARVSQVSRNKVAVALIPQSDEMQDINNAKSCKILLDARAEEMDLDGIHIDGDRIKYIFGDVFQKVCWDKEAGPIHEDAKKYEAAGIKVPVIDATTGKPVKGKYLDSSVHVGDVKVKNYRPHMFHKELFKQAMEDVNHCEFLEWVHVEELKAEYPNKSFDIKPSTRQFMIDDLEHRAVQQNNLVLVHRFYHKKTKQTPKGYYAFWVQDCILEDGDLPYDHGELPVVKDSDISIPGEFWGRSRLVQIETLQKFDNLIMSGIARDHGMSSSPKLMVPKGSVSQSDLNNENGIIQFAGPVAPQLVSPNWLNRGGLEVSQVIQKNISQFMSIYDVSQGQAPNGVTANSALRFLDEQEQQRISPDVTKRKRRTVECYKLMIKTMAQYYDATDGRTVRILGQNNEYLIQDLSDAAFNTIYSVKIQNTSALPDTKTGKIATIFDLNAASQTDPVFSKGEIVRMLDLGLDETFKDQSTIALDSAKTALDMILRGKDAPEPQPYDDMVTFYNVFMRQIQSINFKMKVAIDVKQVVFDYILTLEGLMWEKSLKNPMFAQILSTMPNFPAFFTIPEPMPMVDPMTGMPMADPMMGGMPPEMGMMPPQGGEQMEMMPPITGQPIPITGEAPQTGDMQI